MTPFISTSTPSDDFITKDDGGACLDGSGFRAGGGRPHDRFEVHWPWLRRPLRPRRQQPRRERATTGPASPPTTQLASAVGANEQYGYGVLSVKVTLQGHRIVDVSVANLQTAEQYSQSIAQQVIPVLRQEVLAAQGVRVNAISGATYTTEAYLYSVQSALTKLHF